MAVGVLAKRYRYFLYSRDQHKLRQETELAIGRDYEPGTVLANGAWKPYTEISSSPNNNKFADAKVVAEGYLEDMRYRNSTSEWRRRR